ncbi:Fur family transcriptional regulator [Amycolatopsis palatopharyngis]|uniref:Fur family transcriptional regulator n=1 Tax=Amycolatopsis palatopharyngis TaxID=187982 RepID=UPI000E2772B1|nr:Fur family transcriptional regulator [Amycolatopsis palatopharyngis]
MSAQALWPRFTRQRAAVAHALEQFDDFRSAREIHDALLARGHNIGLTTVYRALQWLADTGIVDVLHVGTGELAYRRCSSRRHHHLICRDCGRTIEVHSEDVLRWIDYVSTQHGFSDVGYTMEIFGRCPTCRAQAPADQRS